MVIAILMESDMTLPDDILEAIIDKVSIYTNLNFFTVTAYQKYL